MHHDNVHTHNDCTNIRVVRNPLTTLGSSGSGLGLLCCHNSGVDLLSILPPDARGRSAVAAALTGANADNWNIGAE